MSLVFKDRVSLNLDRAKIRTQPENAKVFSVTRPIPMSNGLTWSISGYRESVPGHIRICIFVSSRPVVITGYLKIGLQTKNFRRLKYNESKEVPVLRDVATDRITTSMNVVVNVNLSMEGGRLSVTCPTFSECVADRPYDARIVIGKDSIEIHRHFASMISPVFDAMFSHDSKEAKTGIIEINDFDAPTARNVFDYCYGRENMKFTIEEIVGMLRFADKYDIKVIGKRLNGDLSSFISRESFCLLAQYAWEVIGMEHLQQNLIRFLRETPDLMLTSKFAELPMAIKDEIIRVAAWFGNAK